MSDHPLDHEDVLVAITLVHRPTGEQINVQTIVPCDGPPTVREAVRLVSEEAMDLLLGQLENR